MENKLTLEQRIVCERIARNLIRLINAQLLSDIRPALFNWLMYTPEGKAYERREELWFVLEILADFDAPEG